jgi:hypothetical protein
MQIPFGINSFVFRLLAFPFAIAQRRCHFCFFWSFNEPAAVLNLLAFLALLLGLAQTRRTDWSLAKGPAGPGAGRGFGLALHTVYGAGHPVLKATIAGSIWSATAMSACCR